MGRGPHCLRPPLRAALLRRTSRRYRLHADHPDYRDFAYLALTIGMTFQVSDIDLTAKPIRRLAIQHALLSYLFGAVIVALMINIVGSLAG